MNSSDYLLEDYSKAKSEIITTIQMQFNIISILVTASAAAFVYLYKKDSSMVIWTACLIIPGIYAFFGTLWLDQVFRQRRLASYIFLIEKSFYKSDSIEFGWERYIQQLESENGLRRVFRKTRKTVYSSRYYYYICLGLFTFFPVCTYLYGVNTYLYGTDETIWVFIHTYSAPSIGGIIMFFCYFFFMYKYVSKINSLSSKFTTDDEDLKELAYSP